MRWTLKQARENDRIHPPPARPRGGRYSEDALIDRRQLLDLVDRMAARIELGAKRCGECVRIRRTCIACKFDTLLLADLDGDKEAGR